MLTDDETRHPMVYIKTYDGIGWFVTGETGAPVKNRDHPDRRGAAPLPGLRYAPRAGPGWTSFPAWRIGTFCVFKITFL
jgi:hypothetical protein